MHFPIVLALFSFSWNIKCFPFPFFSPLKIRLCFFLMADFHVFLIQDFSLDLQCKPVAVLPKSLFPPGRSLQILIFSSNLSSADIPPAWVSWVSGCVTPRPTPRTGPWGCHVFSALCMDTGGRGTAVPRVSDLQSRASRAAAVSAHCVTDLSIKGTPSRCCDNKP